MAAQSLEEDGWKDEDDDGILEKLSETNNITEFELLVNTDNGARYRGIHIQKDLKI